MDTTETAEPPAPEKKYLTVRQAAFIGVGVRAAGRDRAVPAADVGRLGGRASNGLLIQAGACLVLAVVFKLDSIASIGSAVALVIFTVITAAHLRIRDQTGASLPVLVLAIVAAGAVFVTFVFTTLIHEPASIVTLAGIVVLSIGLDYGWKRGHTGTPSQIQVGGVGH